MYVHLMVRKSSVTYSLHSRRFRSSPESALELLGFALRAARPIDGYTSSLRSNERVPV